MAIGRWTLNESTTVAAGVITLTRPAEPGHQHTLRWFKAKSDLAAGELTVKSAATVLTTLTIGAAERMDFVEVSGATGEALSVALTVTTAGELTITGETR